jgi:hypothetical protein
MLWPWVSRRAHNNALQNARESYVRWVDAEARVQAYQKALDMEEARRRDEQWRRLRAEGHVAYMQERIIRVLGLPIWPGGTG